MVFVRLKTRCYATESRDKVVSALRNLFPDAAIEGQDPIMATSSSTDRFAEMLTRQRIRDAARSVLRRSVEGGKIRFRLNKQVAAVGKVSFSQENHALGDIEVEIESEDADSLIDLIAPDTRRMGA